jgi:transmembrane sensor
VSSIPIVEPINDKAARWAVRAVAGSLSPGEQGELDTWLNADPRHRGAYVLARAQWADLDRLAALHGPTRAAEEDTDTVANTGVDTMTDANANTSPVSSREPSTREPRYRPGMSRRQVLAASAATIAFVGGGLSWLLLRGGPTRYVSGIGEVRRISLEEGSTLLLNTATEVAVELTQHQRTIHLVRGEALFEVARDKARPFVVVANDTAVRAVGTAFVVRLDSSQVEVTVTEGVVEVAPLAAAQVVANTESASLTRRLKRVTATERVVIAAKRAPQISTLAPGEAQRALAWREGQVSFDGETLATAVAEINRHNRRQIVVEDPALAAKPIVGVFRAADPVGFSAAAAVALKARTTVEGDTIRLQPNSALTQK